MLVSVLTQMATVVLEGYGTHKKTGGAQMVRIVDALNQLRPEYMWLPLDIAADLEVLCRNKLFEEFDAVDFYCFLNLRPSMGNYVPLEDNKRRTCYLIRRLSRYI